MASVKGIVYFIICFWRLYQSHNSSEGIEPTERMRDSQPEVAPQLQSHQELKEQARLQMLPPDAGRRGLQHDWRNKLDGLSLLKRSVKILVYEAS